MELKRAEVHKLPTKDETNIIKSGFNTLFYGPPMNVKSSDTYQHLYITTDEEIKEGDWMLNIIEDTIYQKNIYPHHNMWRKIVATTDKSLVICKEHDDSVPYPKMRNVYLPQPSQAFIKKYCEVGGIDEVLVEYENIYDYELKPTLPTGVKPKVDSNNTITIHPIKDSWSNNELKEELELLIELNEDDFDRGSGKHILRQWIKENLRIINIVSA